MPIARGADHLAMLTLSFERPIPKLKGKEGASGGGLTFEPEGWRMVGKMGQSVLKGLRNEQV